MSGGLPRDARKETENKTRRAKSLGRVYNMNREAGHITDFEQIEGARHALAIAAQPANMVVPCSQIAREQTIMRRERFWLQLEAHVLHWTGMEAASHVVSAPGLHNVMFQSVGDPLERSAVGQRTSQDDLPTAQPGGAGPKPDEPGGQTQKLRVRVSLGTCPTTGSERHSQAAPPSCSRPQKPSL
jgi:hypothetical protein